MFTICMKPREVRKILKCSYTSLNNWVKVGKLKYSKTTSDTRHDYDDESVYKLRDEIFGNEKMNNHIILYLNNEKHEFTLNKKIVETIFQVISQQLCEQIKEED